MKAGLWLSGLILVLALTEYALAIGGSRDHGTPAAGTAKTLTVGSDRGGQRPVWGFLLGAGVLLACGGLQFRARRVEKTLRRAMSEAQCLAQAAMTGETARAEREHFVKGLLLALQSQQTLESFGDILLRELSERLGAKAAVFHCLQSCTGDYVLTASYASHLSTSRPERYRPGEGLAGEAVLERRRRLCQGISDDWPWLETGTLATSPVCVVVAPLVSGEHVSGVIELALMERIEADDERLKLLDIALAVVALSLDNLKAQIENQVELTRREQLLRDNENKWRRLFETTDEGVWFADTEARTTDVNPAMARILGEAPERLLGRSLFEFIDATQIALFNEQLRRRGEGEVGTYEISFKRADGCLAPCLVKGSPLLDEQGRQIGIFAIITDLSEHRPPVALSATAE